MKRITTILMSMLFVFALTTQLQAQKNPNNPLGLSSPTSDQMSHPDWNAGEWNDICMTYDASGNPCTLSYRYSIIFGTGQSFYEEVCFPSESPDGRSLTNSTDYFITEIDRSEIPIDILEELGGVSIKSLDVEQLEIKTTKASVLLSITSSILAKKAQQTFFAFAATCGEWENNGSTYTLEHGVTMQPKIRYCVEQIGPWHFSYTTQTRDFQVPIE